MTHPTERGTAHNPMRITFHTLRNWSWFLLSLLSLVICGWLLHQTIMAAPTSIMQSPSLDIWIELAAIAIIGGSLGILYLRINERLRGIIILSLFSLFLLGILSLVLKETSYPFGGLGGDQRFYAAYVTKLATYGSHVDVMYRDLLTFYPPLYYALLGRGAALMDIEPYEMLKYGLLVTALLLPFFLAGLWRNLVNHKAAVLITFVLVFAPNWFKPAEWISAVLFVPWWLYWVENVSQSHPTNGWYRVGWYAIGGVIGGLLFQNYYYWFFIGALSLVVNQIDRWVTKNNPSTPQRFHLLKAVTLLTCAALFSANYWLPYLYSMYTTGGWTPLQNRWLTSGKIEFPLPFVSFSLTGLVSMFGLLTLWVGARWNPLCRGLRNLLIASYLWLLLGYMGILLDQPLLSFRAYPLIEHLLLVGALLGFAGCWFPEMRIWPDAQRKTKDGPRSEALLLLRRCAQLTAPVLIIGLLCFFVVDTARSLKDDKHVVRAQEAQPPQSLLDAFDGLTNNITHDKVLWTDAAYIDVFAYRPLYTFLPWSAHFSHPAGLFHQRVDFLEKLATTHSPSLFAMALMNNRYDAIDYVTLKSVNGQYLFSYSEDNFPDRTRQRTFAYPVTLFAEPYFETRQGDTVNVVLPVRTQNPLSNMSFDQNESITLEAWAQLYALQTTFGSHVTLTGKQPTAMESAQVLSQADLSQLPKEALLDLHMTATDSLAEQTRHAINDRFQADPTVQMLPDLILMDQVGTHKLNILAYAVEERNEQSFQLTLYFEVLSPLDHDYTLWYHAFHDGNKLILDHEPVTPNTSWRVGKIYSDSYIVPVALADSKVEFGFWNTEKDVRLIQTSWEMGVPLVFVE
ncbi:MAG: arabinofuranosyltransferase [Chloroflexota bacterium]